MAGAHTEQCKADDNKPANNNQPGLEPSDQVGSKHNRCQITNKVCGTNEPHPVIGKIKSGLHGWNQHRVGVAGETDAGEYRQKTYTDNDPAIVEK
jgi:hypothetical protein